MSNGSKRTIKGEIVTEYLKKFPKTASKTLARKIYKDNPEVFATLQHVYKTVTYYRGACGQRNRRNITSKEHFRVTDTHNPFDLPEPVEAGLAHPFEFPNKYKNTLILSDIHVPFQDNEALSIAIEYGQKQKLDSILLNGDIFDCYALSRFIKDPRIRDFPGEVEEGKRFLKILHKTFPNAKIFFKMGNHEERWSNYLFVKAPEVVGIEQFEFEAIYDFNELDITKIDSKSRMHFGSHLTGFHGHEFQGSYSPVNPARGIFNQFKENAFCGHWHRPSSHPEKIGRDKKVCLKSIGCLCMLNPLYAPQNKWLHGFAHLIKKDEKKFHLKNYMIIDGGLYES